MPESSRIQAVQEPVVPAVAELIHSHPGTISLGQGVVSYGPPEQSVARIQDFLANPKNHWYKTAYGIPPLLEKIEQKLIDENGISVTEENCLFVTPGANMAFTNALLAIADPGDEIILLSPYYFNHEMAVSLANCHSVVVPVGPDNEVPFENIRAAITPRTRALVTVSPNNPTGAVYGESVMRQADQLCRDFGIYHICDETYEYFMYDGTPHFSPASIPGAAEHTISIYSFSKAYGMASWRLGYMVFPAELRKAIEKAQDTLIICPPAISQWAAIGALEAGADFYRPRIDAIGRVRDVLLEKLEELPDCIEVSRPESAFYSLLRVDTDMSAMELTTRLVKEYGVATMPGDNFGLRDSCCLRISYGPLDKDTLAEGTARLIKGLDALLGAPCV